MEQVGRYTYVLGHRTVGAGGLGPVVARAEGQAAIRTGLGRAATSLTLLVPV
jgi:hypothetical protein